MRLLAPALLALLSATPLLAQKPVPAPTPVGTVTGHVIFADTQRPARFAEIQLLRQPDPVELETIRVANAANKPLTNMPQRTVMLNGRSALDGAFVIPRVPPGDYFVIGVSTGYIFPITRVEEKDSKDLSKILSEVPLIHVAADKTSTAEVTLRRGATIAGRVLYDDGQPVVDVFVSADPDKGGDTAYQTGFGPLMNLQGNLQAGRTDDQGNFRVVGLRAGKYRVSASLKIGGGQRALSTPSGSTMYTGNGGDYPLYFYAPGTMRKSEAKLLDLHEGEQSPDLNIQINLGALHTVSGRVFSKADQQPVNHGRVAFKDPADKDFFRFASIQPDGTWRLPFMPPGTYTLTVGAASEVSDPNVVPLPGTSETFLRRFNDTSSTIILLDHDLIVEDLFLTEHKPSPPK